MLVELNFVPSQNFRSFQINLDHFDQWEAAIFEKKILRPKIYFKISSQQMRLKQIVGGERLVVEWIGELWNLFCLAQLYTQPNLMTNPNLLSLQPYNQLDLWSNFVQLIAL